MNARERRRRNSLGAGSDEPHASAVHRERPRNGQNSSPSQASAEGATRRARCVGARSCALSDESGASNESIGLLAILVTRGTVGSNFETRWNPRGDDAARPNEATAGGKAGGPSGSITGKRFVSGDGRSPAKIKSFAGSGKGRKSGFDGFRLTKDVSRFRSNVVGL
jgi:hypothetical protein